MERSLEASLSGNSVAGALTGLSKPTFFGIIFI